MLQYKKEKDECIYDIIDIFEYFLMIIIKNSYPFDILKAKNSIDYTENEQDELEIEIETPYEI